MICERCETNTNDGNNYKFYYGSLVGSSTSSTGNNTTFTNSYNIAGSKEAFLCNKCIYTIRGEELRNGGIGAGIIIIIISLLLFIKPLLNGDPFFFWVFLPILVSLYIIFNSRTSGNKWLKAANRDYSSLSQEAIENNTKTLEATGDKWLIRKYEPSLRELGHSKFFERNEYHELRIE